MSMRAAVVGAGIVGLAAAEALSRAGVEVRCFERAAPGQAESAGATRIFRCAHGNPELVRLAMRARAGWRAWEARYGRQLVGEEGLVVSGAALAARWRGAMQAAGAPHRLLSREEVEHLLPVCRPPDGASLWDESAGAIRAAQVVECLRAALGERIVPSAVIALHESPAGMRVETTSAAWACDRVLVAAGIGTLPLAAQQGLSLPDALVRHARFTFVPRGPRPELAPACWIEDSGTYGPGLSSYGQPVGDTGQYAVGVEGEEEYAATLEPSEVSRRSLAIARRYVEAALPGLDPTPVGELQCTYNRLGFPDGDGFAATSRGAVTIVYGNNLFKFAPLLGELLCRAMLEEEAPAELMPLVR